MLCFWCGTEQPRNPKADLIPDGSPNARYAPCTACEVVMAVGVTVVEIVNEEHVPLQVGLHIGGGKVVYPTGNWAIMSHEAVVKFQSELGDLTGRYGFCMVSGEVWDLLGLTR